MKVMTRRRPWYVLAALVVAGILLFSLATCCLALSIELGRTYSGLPNGVGCFTVAMLLAFLGGVLFLVAADHKF